MTKSLGKAFLLLDLIASGKRNLTEIARDSNLPASTAHRVLADLIKQGVVAQDNRRYRLGVRLIELGEKAKQDLALGRVALAPMQELAKKTRETVHLGVLDGSDIVYLEKVNGERSLQMTSHVGLRTPAQFTAMGKVLISAQPPENWPHSYQELPAHTENTIRSLDQFLEELERVRRRGYALDREENELGIRCIAAPIRGADGKVHAALSISGATIYISDERQQELVPEVIEHAEAISRELGGGTVVSAR